MGFLLRCFKTRKLRDEFLSLGYVFGNFVLVYNGLKPLFHHVADIAACNVQGQLLHSLLTVIHAVPIAIGIIIKGKGVYGSGQFLRCHFSRFQGSRVNSALFADLHEIPINIGNKAAGRFLNGVQTGL